MFTILRRLSVRLECAYTRKSFTNIVMETAKKVDDKKVIGTHDGTFHCDEVLACALLKILPEYSNAIIRRSRDPTILAACDVVVDVGAQFDPGNHRYDHHQRSFQETFSSLRNEYPWKTRLSSAGLVYVHFGERVISQILDTPPESELVLQVYKKVYENLIEEVDAIDNGISTHDGAPRYKITTNLSSRIANLNPGWNEDDSDIQERFHRAMEVVKSEFFDRVNYYAKIWWPAREKVSVAYHSRFKVDPNGQVMELSEGGCPWKEHLFSLERETGPEEIEKQLLYVIFPGGSDNWRVQAVPVAEQSFESRKPLPEEWCGIRDSELDRVVGIDGCIFVHASGFIGGNKTRQGALDMALLAIKLHKM